MSMFDENNKILENCGVGFSKITNDWTQLTKYIRKAMRKYQHSSAAPTAVSRSLYVFGTVLLKLFAFFFYILLAGDI